MFRKTVLAIVGAIGGFLFGGYTMAYIGINDKIPLMSFAFFMAATFAISLLYVYGKLKGKNQIFFLVSICLLIPILLSIFSSSTP